MVTIGISGSYGGLNLGDEAILTCSIESLHREIPDVKIVVFSRNAKHTEANHAADRVVPVREMTRAEVAAEVRRLDLFLLGGGGILYDREAQTYLRELQVAQELDIPTWTFAISAGPLETPETRRTVAATLTKADGITVREGIAKRLLEEIGVKPEIEVTADPALLLTPEPFTREMLEREGIRTGRHLVGVSVREPGPAAPELGQLRYHALIANAADFIADRLDADLLFVPMERGDIRHSHAVIAEMANPDGAYVLRGDYGPRQILGLMEHLDMAVGMRLHFLMFAAIARIPFVALPYASKVAGFLQDLGLPARVLHEQHAGPLLALIDRLWDHRASFREALDRNMPSLEERARGTARTIARFLETRADEESGTTAPATVG